VVTFGTEFETVISTSEEVDMTMHSHTFFHLYFFIKVL